MCYSEMFHLASRSVSKRSLEQRGHWDRGFESPEAWVITRFF
jgi:hypothetical protein